VIKNTGITELKLNKKHNSINYHIVCISVAAKMMRIAKKIRILILLMHLLNYCIQNDSTHCCDFSRSIRLILRVFIPMTVSLITDIQVRFCPVIRFSFLSDLRGYISAYLCIASMDSQKHDSRGFLLFVLSILDHNI
jgi:hypothetical protein